MKRESLYVQEAEAQAEYALMAYESYKRALEGKDVKSVFYHLHHFVVHVTNIDKILFPNKNRFRSEILKETQSKTSIDISSIRRLRNHLEHFDERMDNYVKNYKGQAYFDNNLITGAKDFPKHNCLRALDGDTYIFYGEEFNLDEIYDHLRPLQIILQDAV
ncbi:hypothetical protein IOQ59_10160 [Pontibacterium sp. N1Y112]|uniref:HEPN domain-containing protein n=1 Tax=Pontibacterium sinense TaxID=2781979 RepID=A0A8J7JYH6_9GAMM|nr:hypothetical protein [Pontibacterium sinense]MBE9397623.1 hypothetical protein [Pontibacterium sinense]